MTYLPQKNCASEKSDKKEEEKKRQREPYHGKKLVVFNKP
jgi:hypothetical protein